MSLFERIVDFENLHRAYLGARKRKRYRSSILKFGYRLEENLLALRRELIRKTYRHGGYREFVVSDSKRRTIKAAPFRDRVVHHALCNLIEPILDKSFIFDSYACRKGKGTHAAVLRLEKFMKSLGRLNRVGNTIPRATVYCLKCDVSKYFDSVDHEILLGLLRKKIVDRDVLWLLGEIVGSNPQTCPEPSARRRGIPIGNLTSQLFANIYLNKLDHFVKRELHEKNYLRYMDDFLILGLDKRRLHKDKELIRTFLRDRLELELHPKKADVFPMDAGVDFLGYRIFQDHRLLRKSTVRRFLRRAKARGKVTREAFQSWYGYATFANSYRLRERLSRMLLIREEK